MGAREAYELLQQYKAENAAGGGASNGNGGGSGSAPSRRTSPLEDYYNEKRQKQAVEKANEIINSDILHGGTKPVGWQQKTAQPSGTSGASTSSRGRGLVGGLRDAWLDKHPNVTMISAKDLPSANQTVYDLQQRKKELEGEKTKNARYSLVDGVLTNNNTDYDAEIADIDKRIAETKKQDDYRTVWDKIVDTVTGAVTGSAASKSDAMRTLYESGQNSRTAEYEREIAQLQKDYDRAKRDYEETLELEGEDAAQWAKNTLDDVERKLNAYKKVVDENVQQKATQAAADLADQLQQDSAERIERAKDGSGAVGRFAVDAGVAATQMGIDALTGRALGIGDVGSKASMALRAFGGGTQEARQGGGDLKQQLGYGGGVAAVELITEKLFDGLAGIYGKGTLDKVAEGVIGNLAKTDAGRTALRVLAGGIGEGSEELISDALNPLLRTIYNGKTVGESYSEEQIADWGYDFLVGAVLGAGGKTVDIATGENAKKNAELRSGSVDSAIELMTGKKAASEPQSAAEAQGDITAPPTPSNDAVTRPAELNSAIGNDAETQNADVQKNTAPTGTENVRISDADLQDYLAVGERQHVRNAKEAQMNSGGSPILTTISQIRSFIRSAMYGEQPNTIKAYGKVGSKMAQDISTASDGKTNVSGYYLELDSNRIRHMKDHVDTDSDGRNIPLTSEQAEQLTDYIDNYDNVLDVLTRKDGSTKVYLSKATDDGHVVVVELVSKGRQSLQPVTAWQNTNEAFESIWGKKRADSASQTGQESGSRGYQPALTETSSRPELPQTKSGFTGDASAEAPASDNSIPTAEQNVNSGQAENSGQQRERGFSKNVRTDNAMESDIRQSFDENPENYSQLANKDTLSKAKEIYDKGLPTARSTVEQALGAAKAGKKLAPEMVPLARMVANELSRNGEVESARNILADVATELTAAGQLGQAGRIMRDSDPNTALRSIEKSLEAINDEFSKQHKHSKWKAELTDAEREKILSTDFTEEGAYQSVYEEIAKRIGKEMPSSAFEKLTEIRRINMLLRPKTMIKSVVSNVPMVGLRKGAETLSIGIQSALTKMGAMDSSKRTRGMASKAQKQLANDFYEANKGDINGQSNKWDMKSMLRENRTIFKGGAIEKAMSKMTGKEIQPFGEALRQVTYDLLEKGDAPFVKSAFVDSLSQYCAAKGITSQDGITREAIDFATANAMEATFKNANLIASLINKVKRESSPGVAMALDVLIPFTTTPANIMHLMGDYSLIGFAKMFSKDGPAAKIDAFSKATVGSAIMALGLALRFADMITGGEDDDKDKAALDKATGRGNYSIGGKVSYDWAQPAGSLLAFGAEIADAIKGQESWVSALMNAIYTAGDSTLNLSLFQNVISVLKGSGKPTQQIIDSIMEGGATQLVPGLAGDIAKIIDGTVRSTYTGGNVVDDTAAKVKAVTPFLSKSLPESVNVKGETNTRGELVERTFNTLINPFNVTRGKRNEVDEEIYRLYDSTGSTTFFPSVSPYKVEYGNKEYSMDGNDRETFQKIQGQKYYELAKPLLDSEMYKSLTDEQKANVLNSVRDFALDAAKRDFIGGKSGRYSSNWDDENQLKALPEFLTAKQALNDGKNGKSDNFDAIDQVLKNFGHLKDDTQTALKASELNVNPLLYAQTKGIKSKSWYDTKAAVDKAKGTLGGTDNAIAIAVYNSMKGKSDAEILDAIRAQVTPKAGGQQKAVVRRAEAYMTIAKGNADLGSWLNLVAELNDADENSSVSKDDVYAAWANMGLSARETYAGITRNDFYNIVKSSKSYATKEKYATQIDEDYAKINPAVEKEKAQLGGTVEGHSKEKSKSNTTYTMDDYYRALGLIK